MQAKFYLMAAFALFMGALGFGWMALQRPAGAGRPVAEQRMRQFARRIEKLARKQNPKNLESLRTLIQAEIAREKAVIVLAGLREDALPLRKVKLQSGVALVGSYPIEFHGQHITLRLATMLERTTPHAHSPRLAA